MFVRLALVNGHPTISSLIATMLILCGDRKPRHANRASLPHRLLISEDRNISRIRSCRSLASCSIFDLL